MPIQTATGGTVQYGGQSELFPAQRGVLRMVRLDAIEETSDTPSESLLESIRAMGVIQPVALIAGSGTEPPDSLCQVAAGRRRIAASRAIGVFGNIPALVFPNGTPRSVAAAMALTENIVRRSSPVTEAIEARRLLAEGFSAEQICEALRLPRNSFHARLRLSVLPPQILEAVRDRRMSLSAARAATLLAENDRQRLLAMLRARGSTTGSIDIDDVMNIRNSSTERYEQREIEAVAASTAEEGEQVAQGRMQRMQYLRVDSGDFMQMVRLPAAVTEEQAARLTEMLANERRVMRLINVLNHPMFAGDNPLASTRDHAAQLAGTSRAEAERAERINPARREIILRNSAEVIARATGLDFANVFTAICRMTDAHTPTVVIPGQARRFSTVPEGTPVAEARAEQREGRASDERVMSWREAVRRAPAAFTSAYALVSAAVAMSFRLDRWAAPAQAEIQSIMVDLNGIADRMQPFAEAEEAATSSAPVGGSATILSSEAPEADARRRRAGRGAGQNARAFDAAVAREVERTATAGPRVRRAARLQPGTDDDRA